ncbi:MAG: signal recognition particle protein [Betaproteobacteria bacterium]|jgi:signal recognition particle subunit SRP54|nr:signal recognition particle protein [Betaproteobacteria bacterium]
MLDNLTNRLNGIVKQLRGQARLSEDNIADTLREVRMALLEADVGLPVVKDFISNVKAKALGADVLQSLTPGQALVGIVHQELIGLMGGEPEAASAPRLPDLNKLPVNLSTTPPAIILMAGLQGAGKTTSVGKLAKILKERFKKKVLVVSADVYRPAAIEQLKTLASQVGVDFFATDISQKPVDIAFAAKQWAKTHFHDVLIIDTAGRLAIDAAMMEEIRAIHAAVEPIETLFTVDAMQGQDAVNVAKAFNEALPLTGVVLTKLDGDSRGGAALSVRHITGKPIKLVGVSEKMDGLEAFYPERMASRILGMGDVLSLVEAAQQSVDTAEAQKLAEKFKKGKDFDFDDFKMQLTQMRKMGGMGALMDKMPAQLSQAAQMAPDLQEKQLRRTEGIINSMTPLERRKPDLLKASRKRRIAAGAGVTVQEVNRILTQFEQMQKMMKMMKGGGMAKMMRGMKGMMPGMR